MSVIPKLRFGIPTLDGLLEGDLVFSEGKGKLKDPNWGGLKLPLQDGRPESTSFCLIGPDGTGKSVFCLHLAARYLKDAQELAKTDEKVRTPKVIYVSTDLRYEMASKISENFELPVELMRLETVNYGKIRDFLMGKDLDGDKAKVGFVDLASESAGDDWALVARLIALLEEPPAEPDGPKWPMHLLILDAVEGLETLAGEMDAYGQKISRRARIALLIRLATHKCHLGLVVEEAEIEKRLPEEFVADTVIRLRSNLINGYTRRTLEIEKARGQPIHTRGQHPFRIGTKPRPNTSLVPTVQQDDHVTVFPSLHFHGNTVRSDDSQVAKKPPTDKLSSFGIQYLDSMLQQTEVGLAGLPSGRPFAIIGDSGTFKTAIAESFLSQAFVDVARDFKGATSEWKKFWSRNHGEAGTAVLCVSRPITTDEFAKSIATHIVGCFPGISNSDPRSQIWIEGLSKDILHTNRIIVDQMAIHDQPGPRLIYRLRSLIERALAKPGMKENPWLVRLVFDDLTIFRDTYPDLENDPLLLPLTIRVTRQAGISTLVVATAAGRPDGAPLGNFDARLRSLVDGQFLTWRVPFFGTTKTAITFVPGFQLPRQPTIRTINPSRTAECAANMVVEVDPEFELYEGIENGAPQPVPLEIRLYAETPAFTGYLTEENLLMRNLFPPAAGQADVINGVPRREYNWLRDYCYLSGGEKLQKTLIIQIDEFWNPSSLAATFADLREYVDTPVDYAEDADKFEDYFRVFRRKALCPGEIKQPSDPLTIGTYPLRPTRRDYFPEYRQPGPVFQEIKRIPYMWDFGFLLLSHEDWFAAQNTELPILSRMLFEENIKQKASGKCVSAVQKCENYLTVGTVLRSLTKPTESFEDADLTQAAKENAYIEDLAKNGKLLRGPSSWRAAIEASCAVAHRRKSKDSFPSRALDLARPAGESFSSLLLEIWLSEIVEQYSARIRVLQKEKMEFSEVEMALEEFLKKLEGWDPKDQYSLIDLIETYHRELYMAWILLIESLDLDSLIDRDSRFALKAEGETTKTMATRHWYKTACDSGNTSFTSEPSLPVRLPGYFSVRGDWHLALAKGSRSYRLGTRALDLMNSRAANISRLQRGMGLPVRDIASPESLKMFRTKLSLINRSSRRATLGYQDLIGLGADDTARLYREAMTGPEESLKPGQRATSDDNKKATQKQLARHYRQKSEDTFFWIWRSRIRHYDRHSRMWQKWVVRVLLAFHGIKNERSMIWRSGFSVYDEIASYVAGDGTTAGTDNLMSSLSKLQVATKQVPESVEELKTYSRFVELCRFVSRELTWHTPGSIEDHCSPPEESESS